MIAINEVKQKILDYYEQNPTYATERKNEFLEALREKGIVVRACEATGIDRPTVYLWRQIDPEFREAWDSILEDSTDNVEESLYDMAVSRKNVVATIFYLKGNRAKYRDRLQVDVSAAQREIEERLQQLSIGNRDSLPLHNPAGGQSAIVDSSNSKLLTEGNNTEYLDSPAASSSSHSAKAIINEVLSGPR